MTAEPTPVPIVISVVAVGQRRDRRERRLHRDIKPSNIVIDTDGVAVHACRRNPWRRIFGGMMT